MEQESQAGGLVAASGGAQPRGKRAVGLGSHWQAEGSLSLREDLNLKGLGGTTREQQRPAGGSSLKLPRRHIVMPGP
eukprot:3572450-Rhodomonas_salina.2